MFLLKNIQFLKYQEWQNKMFHYLIVYQYSQFLLIKKKRFENKQV